MKTKIKFSDIAGMLERDEMREITGACGNACGGPNSYYYSGGGGGSSSYYAGSSILAGFGGGTAIGSTFGGQPYSGYNNFNSSPTNNNYSSNSYSSNNYSSGWNNTAGGLKTNDPNAISRYFGFVYANSGVVTSAQTNAFIRNEGTVAGQQANNVAYSIQLNEVLVKNTYHGPSTIPQGIVINNNGVVQINITGGTAQNSGSSSTSYSLPQGVPPTDCFFQCLGWISQMNGDTVHDANYYARVYAFTHPKTSVIPNFNLSSFNKPNTNGMPLAQASAFAGTFFKATDYSGASNQFLSNWINPNSNPNGDHQLIGVYRTETGGLHAIAVTSINGSNISFYDPQKGISDSRDMSKFVSFYGINNKP
jgi:hypothetical protein